ncbi:MAG: hemolysin-type calcium-binding protein, partial [Chthoniobacterales bacterium]|nr:hemolysin-type calcium-binding protein [Chthoniobacterales bacterium]
MKLVNHTGQTITSFQVGYTGEQWRRSGPDAQAIEFQYSLTATAIDAGAYTAVPALNFASPVSGGGAGATAGNTAACRTVISPVTIANI